ncbi:MAG TPA: hypothetical protein VES93_05265 [Ornithinibacter sp.]|nr:hypothetical protein [Ornithinibacter sp.]
MIRNRTWRRAMVATVVGADVVVLGVAGAGLPAFVPVALGALVVGTLWALARPGGWGAFTLLVVQVLAVAVPGGVPESVVHWVLAAAAGTAVILTHLALTLLGSWPARADLPRETALRWAGQAAALVWSAIGAALLGALATSTPLGWAPWIGAVGLGLVAATVWQLRANTRRS